MAWKVKPGGGLVYSTENVAWFWPTSSGLVWDSTLAYVRDNDNMSEELRGISDAAAAPMNAVALLTAAESLKANFDRKRHLDRTLVSRRAVTLRRKHFFDTSQWTTLARRNEEFLFLSVRISKQQAREFPLLVAAFNL